MSFTERVSDFIRGTRYENVPEDAVIRAKLSFLDIVGIAMAASVQPIAKIAEKHLEFVGGRRQCSVIGLGLKTSVPNAALMNGILAHALDFDDTAEGSYIHPSAPVLPAALALGELINAPGKDVLTSFIVGVEVECAVGSAINPGHYSRGFHVTGTLGAFGAAAAAGKLLDLNRDQMLHALGIVASLSSGILANSGTMTKPLHAGRAAENGVVAALLAKRGFTSAKDVFVRDAGGHERWGYFNIVKGATGVDLKAVDRLGKDWTFADGVVYKLYPSCLAIHASLNAILHLIREHDIKPDEVESVDVGESEFQYAHARIHEPKTGLEGKFSTEFCIAVGLLEGAVKLEHFTDKKPQDPNVAEIMRKVKPHIKYPKEFGATVSEVTVKMKDGQTWTAIGNLKWTPGQLVEKYKNCARMVLPEEKVTKLVDLVQNIEEVNDVKTLIELTYH